MTAAAFNDGCDPEHCLRAAPSVNAHNRLFDLNEQQFEVLITAMSVDPHAFPSGKACNNPTLAACWDSDSFDLPRVEIIPDPNLLLATGVDTQPSNT